MASLPPRPDIPPVTLPDGRALPVALRVSTRARRIALRLLPTGDAVELVLPRPGMLSAGLDFLETKRDWIGARATTLPTRVPFVEGAIVPILGEPHRLVALGQGRRGFAIAEGRIEVAGAPEHVARRTRDGIKAHARRLFEEKTLAVAHGLGRMPTRVSVSEAVSRWGSCAPTGRIRYAWRLLLAPERVVDYVVAHEVAHLVELNHSPRFWRLVETLHPAWRSDRAWLKRHGGGLLAFG
jgi:hypothetical protein